MQQLPPGEFIQALTERLKLFKSNPLAQLGVQHAQHADKVYKKDIKLVVDGQVSASNGAKPVLDVKQLTSQVNDDNNTMARLLKRAGLTNEVSVALKQHNGTLPVALALIDLAKNSANGAVKGLLTEYRDEVKLLEAADSRMKDGGHPAFDLKTSKAARECWIHLDAATDILAACLRMAGIVNDPTYASRPMVKSVLRPTLEQQVGPPAHKPRGAGGKKAKGKAGDGKDAGGKGASGSNTGGNGAPAGNGATPSGPTTT